MTVFSYLGVLPLLIAILCIASYIILGGRLSYRVV